MKVLDYNGLISLTDIIKENIIFRDTKENVKKAIDEGKIPENAVVIITDDTASNGQECNFTPADIGLDKVGNYKAVSTEASQELTEEEKLNARNNIGAGTSSFSGNYNDLSNKPPIPTKTSELKNDSGFINNNSTPRAYALVGNSMTFYDTAKFAEKLNTMANDGKSVSPTIAGNEHLPCYFDDGVPKPIDVLDGTYMLATSLDDKRLVTSAGIKSYFGYQITQYMNGVIKMETGTWTPKLYSATINGNDTLVNHKFNITGKYYKIGRLVYVICASYINKNTDAIAFGKIRGLPFLPISVESSLKCPVGFGCIIFNDNATVTTGTSVVNLEIQVNYRDSSGISINIGKNFYCNAIYITS